MRQETSAAGEARSWAPPRIGERQIRIALGAAMAASAVLAIRFGRGTSFSLDELDWFSRTPHLDVRTAFQPYLGHLILIPRLVYAAILNTFGVDYLSFRLLTIGVVLLTVGLFFEFARRRVGAVLALAPSLVLLVYGPDSEHLLTGNGFTVLFPIAAGIGAFLALEREDLVGDLAACLLLCLAVATYSVGIAFLVGAAVLILFGSDRWHRAWVFLVPGLLYFAWLLWSRHIGASTTGENITLSNLLLAPDWAANSLATVAASLLGLKYSAFGTDWGPPVAILAVIAIGWRLSVGNVVTRWLVGAMAIPATLWLLGAAAAAPAEFRVPSNPRYLFPATIGVLLVAAEAARGARLGRRGVLILYGVTAISLATNVILLRDGGVTFREVGNEFRAHVAAVVIGGGRLGPKLETTLVGPVMRREGEQAIGPSFMEAVRKYGSPGFSLTEVRALPENLREGVDGNLADSLGVHLSRTSKPAKHCRGVNGRGFRLPVGGAVLRAKGPPAALKLRRFGTEFRIQVGTLAPGVSMALSVPPDAAPDPWYASTSTGLLSICGQHG